MSDLETDVLIVGAGAAGLVAALNASGRRVCVLAPSALETADTASDIAQGGIAAAVSADDSPPVVARTIEATPPAPTPDCRRQAHIENVFNTAAVRHGRRARRIGARSRPDLDQGRQGTTQGMLTPDEITLGPSVCA